MGIGYTTKQYERLVALDGCCVERVDEIESVGPRKRRSACLGNRAAMSEV